MKSTLWQLVKDYLRQNESEGELQKRIEQLKLSDEIKSLLQTVKLAIQDLLWDEEIQAEVEDILLYLNHSSIDVYVQTSRKISEVLWLPLSNYQKEFDVLDEQWIEVKFLWDVQSDWKMKKGSRNLTSVLGYQAKDFYFWNLTYSQIIYEEDLLRVQQEVDSYLKEWRTEYLQEYRVKKWDWTIITVLDRTYVEYDENGVPIYIYWYIYNIDDTKQLERKISELTSELEIDRKTWEKSHSKLLTDLEQYCLNRRPLDRTLKWISIVWPETPECECDKVKWCERCNFTILKVTNFDRLLSFCDTVEEKSSVTRQIILLIKQRFPQIAWFYAISDWKYGIIWPSRVTKELITFWDDTIRIWWNTFNIDIVFWWVSNIVKFSTWLDIYKKANLIMKHQSFSEWNWFYYSEEVEEKIKEHELKSQLLDSTINTCLEEDWFIPYYQWIRDNRTWKIMKYEVLGRVNTWSQWISIQEYLDRLSETSKLPLVMMRILDKALQEIQNHPDVDISVNFTESELTPEFINWFWLRLKEYQISTNRITIEVVETTHSNTDLVDSISSLKELWFKIAIDDFWTWYSNMQRLLHVHPDFLKIDGSLIDWISRNKKQLDVVKAFLQIAKILQAQVIAEKIDDQDDQDVLEILWVEFTQGYLYSKPSPSLIKN